MRTLVYRFVTLYTGDRLAELCRRGRLMQRMDESGDMVPSEKAAQLRKEAIAWVIRLHRGDLSPEDRRAFDAWHARSPAHALMLEKVSSLWDSPDLSEAAVAAADAQPIGFKAKPVLSRRQSILAAACVIVLTIVAVHFDVVTRWQADYRTAVGERLTIELPDRSIATLNTRSAIAISFDGTVRRVRLLKGEASFNVRHDSDRPFIVESADTDTRATGTVFIVQTDPGKDQVTVIEGSVEVGARGVVGSPAIVTAGWRIHTEQGRLGRPYAADIVSASAWLRGRLVVNGVSFAQVLEELRRYHPGTIVLTNQRAGNTKVTGTYSVDDPVGALALLVKTVPISVIRLTDRLAILF